MTASQISININKTTLNIGEVLDIVGVVESASCYFGYCPDINEGSVILDITNTSTGQSYNFMVFPFGFGVLYNYKGLFASSAVGTYEVFAVFPGNSEYEASQSRKLTFEVVSPPTCIPEGERNWHVGLGCCAGLHEDGLYGLCVKNTVTPPTTCTKEGDYNVPLDGSDCCPGLHTSLDPFSPSLLGTCVKDISTPPTTTEFEMWDGMYLLGYSTTGGKYYAGSNTMGGDQQTYDNETGTYSNNKDWLVATLYVAKRLHAAWIPLYESTLCVPTGCSQPLNGKDTCGSSNSACNPTGDGGGTKMIYTINTIKDLKGTVDDTTTGPLWHLILPDGSRKEVYYGPKGSIPVTFIDVDGTEQIGVYKLNAWGKGDYALDQGYSFGFANLYVEEKDVKVLSTVAGKTVQIEYPIKPANLAVPIALAIGLGLGYKLLKKRR